MNCGSKIYLAVKGVIVIITLVASVLVFAGVATGDLQFVVGAIMLAVAAFAGYDVWGMAELRKQVNRLSKENNRFVENNDNLKNQINSLDSIRAKMQSENTKLQTQNTKLTNNLKKQETQLNKLLKIQKQSKQLIASLMNMGDEYSDLNLELGKNVSRITDVSDAMDVILNKIASEKFDEIDKNDDGIITQEELMEWSQTRK